MKLIHNMYRSYPPPVWAVELINAERYAELKQRITHALGRLKAWEHLEIRGFKIDGYETQEIVEQVREIRKQWGLNKNQLVIRREINKVQVWKIPDSCTNWQARVKDVLQKGAVIAHGHVEFSPPRDKKKKVKLPDLNTYLLAREDGE